MKRLSHLPPHLYSALSKAATLIERYYGKSTRRHEPRLASDHLFDVVIVVARYRQDESSLLAALGHDFIEDYRESKPQIESQFPPRAVELIMMLTKPPCGPSDIERENRNKLYWSHLASDNTALLIKLADTLCNVPGIHESDKYKARFIREKSQFLDIVKEAAFLEDDTKELWMTLNDKVSKLRKDNPSKNENI